MGNAMPSFGCSDFGHVNLGHKRRTDRLVLLVDQLCRHPGGTLPDKLNRPPDLRAFYRLMNRPEATHEVLMESHAAATRQRIAALGSGVLCVDISDSLSDTFEYLAYEVTHCRSFVLRAKENRKLVQPVAGQRYLLDAARQLPSAGSRPLQVLGSPQRSARQTTVQIAFAAVQLAVPRKHMGEYAKRPLDLWVIRVWEPQTPKGEEPLEWILLTDVSVTDCSQAEVRIDWYERRPIIDEVHKGMKTGCGIVTMQFEKIERLEPAIALLSAAGATPRRF